jgi:hypothetical protein
VTTELAVIVTPRTPPARANQADSRIAQRLCSACYKSAAWMPENHSVSVSWAGEALLPRTGGENGKMTELGRISRICLECAAIFGHLP